MPKKILFVCTGNTCRSPMAAGFMKRIAAGKDVEVMSAGTAAFSGSPASDEAIEVMQEEDVDITDHRARALDGFLLEEADDVYVMTEGHLTFITSWFRSMKNKVRLIRELDPVKDDSVYPNIPDPLGQPIEEYRKIRDLLKRVIMVLGSVL